MEGEISQSFCAKSNHSSFMFTKSLSKERGEMQRREKKTHHCHWLLFLSLNMSSNCICLLVPREGKGDKSLCKGQASPIMVESILTKFPKDPLF